MVSGKRVFCWDCWHPEVDTETHFVKVTIVAAIPPSLHFLHSVVPSSLTAFLPSLSCFLPSFSSSFPSFLVFLPSFLSAFPHSVEKERPEEVNHCPCSSVGPTCCLHSVSDCLLSAESQRKDVALLLPRDFYSIFPFGKKAMQIMEEEETKRTIRNF